MASTPLHPAAMRRLSIALTSVAVLLYVRDMSETTSPGQRHVLTGVKQSLNSVYEAMWFVSDEDREEIRARHKRQQ